MEADQDTQAALFDFTQQWREDCSQGQVRPLAEYLQRFPDNPEGVAREYLRLKAEAGTRSSVAPAAPLPGSKAGRESSKDLDEANQGHFALTARYTRLNEIARGGMGRIVRVRDEQLHRDLAMKIALRLGQTAISRFEEEAEITSKLDHPGVVPVHDAGMDDEGRPFFTMKLVEGRDLREIIQLVHRKSEGWSLSRALEVLLKVCDTMAFAHSRGIVHRDLKPSNVRIGSFGEVYVIDWGLAKASGRPERHDLRLRSTLQGGSGQASRASGSALDSPLFTMDGDVIGTPNSMSPEQAMGRLSEIGPTSDVYSVGAMLYEILSGRMPYVRAGERISAAEVLTRVLAGPPVPLVEICPESSSELVAICNKAMARNPGERYADMREMAADVRAYLQLRVVRAHGGGRLAALQKWVARNRGLSYSIAATLVVAIGALAVIAVLQRQHRRRLELLADARAPVDLNARALDLCPSLPERIPEMQRWLAEARDVVSRYDGYQREFDDLRARALPWNPEGPREKAAAESRHRRLAYCERLVDYYHSEEARMTRSGGLSSEGQSLEYVQTKIAAVTLGAKRISEEQPGRLTWNFSDSQDHFRYDALAGLLPQLRPFLDSPQGPGLTSLMQKRLDFALRVERDTITDPREAWKVAIASIADPAQTPVYNGLAIRPQIGLVPLRRDPHSGLWEFIHLESGDPPQLRVDGEYDLAPETGIILVLIPGSEFEMGAQREDPRAPNYDPMAEPVESSHAEGKSRAVHAMLAPYFISKYEMTQAQWRRSAGRNPSEWNSESKPNEVHSALHPVESVDWSACMQVTRELGLTLPTEAQWESATRGGTATPWWTGSTPASLAGAANMTDSESVDSFVRTSEDERASQGGPSVRRLHVPVGSLRPNAYGLYDVCGNVAEWCRDKGGTSYDIITEVQFETFERAIWGQGVRVVRGGSASQRATACRSSARVFLGPDYAGPDTGLRPSREIDW